MRAAADGPRIARLIADDILTDVPACNLGQFPADQTNAFQAARAA